MNGRLRIVSWATVAAAVTLVATHGEAFFDALLGFPRLIAAWSSQMPFGAASFLLALALSAASCAFTLRWLPACRNDASRHFVAETLAIVVAVTVSILQQPDNKPADFLTSLWLGLLAGFSAPWMVRGIRAALVGLKAERRDDAGEP